MPNRTVKMNASRNRRLRKRRRQRRILIAIMVIIVAALLLVGTYIWGKLRKMDNISIKKEVNDLAEGTLQGMEGYTTLALFGLDNRTLGNFKTGNSDTIIIASINNKSGEIKMVSVYRDTYLDIGNNTFQKANAAYNNGGPEQAVNMLNKNLDLNISDYVSVDFLGLVEVVDKLGGIELEITEAEAANIGGYIDEIAEKTNKSNAYPSAGTQMVNGVQATAYARIRYTTGWDFKRTERQRTVLTKIFEKAKTAGLPTLNNILDTVLPDVSTSLNAAELLKMATNAAKYNMGENTGFPSEQESAKIGNLGDTIVPIGLEANVVRLHEFLYENESYTPSATVKELSAAIRSNTGY